MQWDLGLQGIGVLVAMALGLGLFARLVVGRSVTRWFGPATAGLFLVAGVVVSEVFFGWATQEELQPNIDGLSFDEVLLIAGLPAIAAVLLARRLIRHRYARPAEAERPGPRRHPASRG